jgi:hypothetical protein
MFSIIGHKLKVVREDSEVGVYFVADSDPSVWVKVAGHLGENTASKLIGVIPALSAGKRTDLSRTLVVGQTSVIRQRARRAYTYKTRMT